MYRKKRFIEERRQAYKAQDEAEKKAKNQGGTSLKITRETALKMAKKFNINLKVVPIQEFQKGIQIELEHGKMLGKVTNVTQNNIQMTTRIAIAHLIEDPRYYKHLEALEKKREIYWKTRTKPSIFQ
jgi:NH3-dependent NAD+ synthetase